MDGLRPRQALLFLLLHTHSPSLLKVPAAAFECVLIMTAFIFSRFIAAESSLTVFLHTCFCDLIIVSECV